MKIVFTCGGTGGHIYPAMAVANMVRERHPDADILFVGAEGGMETKLVPREGFAIKTVSISNLRHKLTPAAMWHNLKVGAGMLSSLSQAKTILKEFRPELVLGTGGYASFPVIYEASRLKIPTAIHSLDVYPGLTTRMLIKHVDLILVNFEDSVPLFPPNKQVLVVGAPVRDDFLMGDRQAARTALGISDKPLVVSFWGSLGAREMNKKMVEFIALETQKEDFHHIHATGKFGYKWMPQMIEEAGIRLEAHPLVQVREFIYDMPQVMAAADLVICRAGASTLGEILAAGKPAILVPSPNVTDNHQEKNARVLSGRGAARLILESECTGRTLWEETVRLLQNKSDLDTMTDNLRKMAILDAVPRIYDALISLYRRKIN